MRQITAREAFEISNKDDMPNLEAQISFINKVIEAQAKKVTKAHIKIDGRLASEIESHYMSLGFSVRSRGFAASESVMVQIGWGQYQKQEVIE